MSSTPNNQSSETSQMARGFAAAKELQGRARIILGNTPEVARAVLTLMDFPNLAVEVQLTSYQLAGNRYCSIYTHTVCGDSIIEQTLVLPPTVTNCEEAMPSLLVSQGFSASILNPLREALHAKLSA